MGGLSVRGAIAGAVVGGICRGAMAASAFSHTGTDAFAAVLVTSLFGVVIGAIAGSFGRIGLGALIGAVLSLGLYLLTAPLVVFLQMLGAVVRPPLLLVLAVGALSGVAGGAAEWMAARRRPVRAS